MLYIAQSFSTLRGNTTALLIAAHDHELEISVGLKSRVILYQLLVETFLSAYLALSKVANESGGGSQPCGWGFCVALPIVRSLHVV